jgi:hypothetical protein
MQFINSSIGLDDNVIMDDINYSAISGPSFTPGIGGTYKESPPPFKPPVDEPSQWQDEEPSQGCAKTLTAGWRTHSFCTPKEKTCDLDRPYEPQRHIEPGRLQYLACEMKKKGIKPTKTTKIDIKDMLMYIVFVYIVYLIYIKFLRL